MDTRKRRAPWRAPLAALVVVAFLALTAVAIAGGKAEQPATPQTAQAAGSATPAQKGVVTPQSVEQIHYSFRNVAAKVLPTVVEINVVDVVKQKIPQFVSPFEFFFGQQPKDKRQTPQEREFKRYGLGSGVIVRQTGSKVYVLTNNHVAGQADEISVRLTDGRQYKARLVGKDPRRDLALVVFETKEHVPVAELGDSDSLEVVDLVLAVGNPLGFESTVTAGIVSAIGRRPPQQGSGIASYTEYIQTDAAINEGNSGGALVDMDGKVIGINTWIASPSGGSIGIGFAIPINNAKKAIQDFITKGKIEYGWLGVSIGDLPPEAAQDLGVADLKGGFVYGVFKDSPAYKAGLLPGDLITKINGEPVKDSTQVVLEVGDLVAGQTATFGVVREGKSLTVSVKIATRKEEAEIKKQAGKMWPGMVVVKITTDIRKQLQLPKNAGEVIIGNVEENSPAGVAGFRPGDIIRTINGQAIGSVADFYRALNDLSKKELMFKIFREGHELLIGLVR